MKSVTDFISQTKTAVVAKKSKKNILLFVILLFAQNLLILKNVAA